MHDKTPPISASGLLALGFLALALLFAAVAWANGDSFYFRLATEALIFGGLALSVDLLLGLVGLLCLGQALFFGFGAYVSALFLKEVAPSFWGAMAVVLISATVFGALAGVIANRAKGVYFALITFGLAQVAGKVVFNTRELGASDGLIGIPVIDIGVGPLAFSAAHPGGFFLLTLAVVLGCYALLAYLNGTPLGRMWAAIRVNEHRVPFLGFHPWRYKLVAFIIAADIAALSGALYPMLRGFVSPELIAFSVSGNAVIAVIVGGTGTLIGALAGSVLLTMLKSVVGSFTEHHLVVIGVLFMLVVCVFPKGLMGYLKPLLERKRG